MSRLDDIRGNAGNGRAAILEGPKPKGIIKEPYSAFSAPTGDPQLRLIIYAKKYYLMPQYSVMYDVFFSGLGEGVSLIFPHHRILLWGKNLLPLVTALRTNSVEWLREFDPVFFLEPDESDAPIIESIDIITTVQNPMGDPNAPEGSGVQ